MSALRLVTDGDAAPAADTPEGHIRNCIQLLILAEGRVAELTIPPDAALVGLLRTAEARCFRALFELGQEVRP